MAHIIDAVLQLKDQFSGQLKHISKGLSDFQKQTKYVASDMKKVGKATENIGKDLMTHVTVPLAGVGVAALKASNDFQDGMAKVSTIADTTKVSLNTLSKGVIDLSNETGLKVTELAEAEYQALSASVDTAKVTEFLGVAAKSAKGGFTDTTTAVDGLTNVLNAYGMEADKALDIANQMLITQNKGKTDFGQLASNVGKLTPITAQLGVSTEELFSSLASTTTQGLATSEAVTALTAAMSNIIKPSKEASEAAEMLGVDFSVSALKSKGWIGFLKDVKKGLENASPEFKKTQDQLSKNVYRMTDLEKAGKKNSDEYKKLAKANKILSDEFEKLAKMSDSPISAMSTLFGSVNGLNSILMLTSNNGMKIYNETIKEMKTNTTAVQDAYDKMLTPAEKFRQSLNRAKNSLLGIGGALTPMMESLGNVIDKITSKISSLTPEQQKLIVKFSLIAAGVGPIVFGLGKITKGLGNTISSINKFSSAVKKAGGLLKYFTSPGHMVVLVLASIAIVAALVIKHWKDICQFTDKVKEKLIDLKNGALDKLHTAFEKVNKRIESFKKGLKSAEPIIKKIATVLGVIFGPALVKTGVQAAIAGSKIAGNFVASIIKAGVQAVLNGAKLTTSFIASIIKTGVQSTIAGAKITASFIAAIVKTGIQAGKTAAVITGKLIVAIISYAVQGWKAIASIVAQTTAWIIQKGIVVAHTAGLVTLKIAQVALSGATTILTGAIKLLNLAFVATPIGWVVLGIGLIVTAVIALHKAWTSNWHGIQEKTKAVIDKIKGWWDSLKEWLKHPITGTVSLIKHGNLSGVKKDGSHAIGLNRVPFDGYMAELHEGEGVLTKKEVNIMDSKKSNGNISITFGDVHVRKESDIDAIANAIVKKLQIQRTNMA